jgi:hypothetical protein
MQDGNVVGQKLLNKPLFGVTTTCIFHHRISFSILIQPAPNLAVTLTLLELWLQTFMCLSLALVSRASCVARF